MKQDKVERLNVKIRSKMTDFLHSAGMPTMIPWRGSDFRDSNYKMIRAGLPPPLL